MKRSGILLLVVALCSAGCQSQHQKNKQAALDRWQGARSQLSLNMARQQWDTGELDKAVQSARRALELNPRNTDGLILLARLALEQNQAAAAEQHLLQCLELKPDHAEALYYLGVVYEQWHNLDQAAVYYEKAWQARSDYSPYLCALVETRVNQGKTQQALDLLLAQMDKMSRDASLLALAGNIYAALGDDNHAAAMFQEAFNLDPQNKPLMETLALTLYRLQKYREALVLLEQLPPPAADRPASGAPLAAQGDCYLKLEQFHKAQRCFEQITDRDPVNDRAWIGQAQVSLAKKEYDSARKSINRALVLHSDNMQAHFLLGYILLQQTNYDQALQEFALVLQNNENDALAHCCLGQTYLALGDDAQAKASFERALQLDPHDSLARKLLDSLSVSGKEISKNDT